MAAPFCTSRFPRTAFSTRVSASRASRSEPVSARNKAVRSRFLSMRFHLTLFPLEVKVARRSGGHLGDRIKLQSGFLVGPLNGIGIRREVQAEHAAFAGIDKGL